MVYEWQGHPVANNSFFREYSSYNAPKGVPATLLVHISTERGKYAKANESGISASKVTLGKVNSPISLGKNMAKKSYFPRFFATWDGLFLIPTSIVTNHDIFSSQKVLNEGKTAESFIG